MKFLLRQIMSTGTVGWNDDVILTCLQILTDMSCLHQFLVDSEEKDLPTTGSVYAPIFPLHNTLLFLLIRELIFFGIQSRRKTKSYTWCLFSIYATPWRHAAHFKHVQVL